MKRLNLTTYTLVPKLHVSLKFLPQTNEETSKNNKLYFHSAKLIKHCYEHCTDLYSALWEKLHWHLKIQPPQLCLNIKLSIRSGNISKLNIKPVALQAEIQTTRRWWQIWPQMKTKLSRKLSQSNIQQSGIFSVIKDHQSKLQAISAEILQQLDCNFEMLCSGTDIPNLEMQSCSSIFSLPRRCF